MNKKKLLKFSAAWCSPCKQLSEALLKLADDKFPYEITEIDIQKDPGITEFWGVKGIPTLIVVDSNMQEVKRKTGYINVNKLKEFLNE